jgi:hypothetical protein
MLHCGRHKHAYDERVNTTHTKKCRQVISRLRMGVTLPRESLDPGVLRTLVDRGILVWSGHDTQMSPTMGPGEHYIANPDAFEA